MLALLSVGLSLLSEPRSYTSRVEQFREYEKFTKPGWWNNVVPTLFECSVEQETQFSGIWADALVSKAAAIGKLIKGEPKANEFFGGTPDDIVITLKAIATYSKAFITPFNVTCVEFDELDQVYDQSDEKGAMLQLGPDFFGNNVNGYNSASGQLVSLQTQLTGAISRNLDVAGVKALAVDSPTTALATAEAYQYFSESVQYYLE
eukprot:NODE_407_length_9242_cov_0.441868.p4 type:complete len:205 gc:universal NODE_407_length_9242_cov_0.441868:4969-5583(+)